MWKLKLADVKTGGVIWWCCNIAQFVPWSLILNAGHQALPKPKPEMVYEPLQLLWIEFPASCKRCYREEVYEHVQNDKKRIQQFKGRRLFSPRWSKQQSNYIMITEIKLSHTRCCDATTAASHPSFRNYQPQGSTEALEPASLISPPGSRPGRSCWWTRRRSSPCWTAQPPGSGCWGPAQTNQMLNFIAFSGFIATRIEQLKQSYSRSVMSLVPML